MNFEQPKPDSKKYSDLISEIQKGIIKIPKFQRDFVWSIDKTGSFPFRVGNTVKTSQSYPVA